MSFGGSEVSPSFRFRMTCVMKKKPIHVFGLFQMKSHFPPFPLPETKNNKDNGEGGHSKVACGISRPVYKPSKPKTSPGKQTRQEGNPRDPTNEGGTREPKAHTHTQHNPGGRGGTPGPNENPPQSHVLLTWRPGLENTPG